MISIKPENNTVRDNYKLLIGSVIPRPIAFVTSMTDDNTINGAPYSFFNVVTANPPMISISVARQKEREKDTARNIAERKEFVVHIVDEENVMKVNKTAATLPSGESEIEIAQLSLLDSEVISTPGIKEAKVRFECVLEQIIELDGTEGTVGTDLIVGKIVCIHMDKTVYEDGKIIYDQFQPVSRLAGNDYAKVGEIFSIKRPR
ncbi:flavin reductase family protein [Virgibacillus ainsalahensis]